MKRRISAFLCAAVFMAVAASPAWGDAGAPGTTFPEQPGSNLQNGCLAVTSNPGTSPGGRFDQNVPTFVNDQLTALLVDACGGP
jgi:hypothetical protein